MISFLASYYLREGYLLLLLVSIFFLLGFLGDSITIPLSSYLNVTFPLVYSDFSDCCLVKATECSPLTDLKLFKEMFSEKRRTLEPTSSSQISKVTIS